MDMKDIKKAIVKRYTISTPSGLLGYPTAITMRLCYNNDICNKPVKSFPADSADNFSWQYFVELHDLHANAIYSEKLENCTIFDSFPSVSQ